MRSDRIREKEMFFFSQRPINRKLRTGKSAAKKGSADC